MVTNMTRSKYRYGLILALLLALAAPAALAGELDGKWEFTFDTEVGPRTFLITLQTNGEKLTAKIDSDTLEGEVRDGKFTVRGEYYAEEAGYTGDMELEGALEGEKLTGKGHWEDYEFTFTARRVE